MKNVSTVRRLGQAVCLALAALSIAATGPDRRVADAAQAKNWPLVRSLVKQRVDVKTPQADGATALHWASHWNDADIVGLLLQASAAVNAANDLGVTPLALAAENASPAVTQRLLAAGADPNAANQSGETVLMTAAETGNVEVVNVLLAKGANPNLKERTQDQTALMWAAAEGHATSVGALIRGGADVHARSKGGSTPLLFAARTGSLDSSKLLLDAGADVNAVNQGGESALLIAAGSGHGRLGVLLLQHGADHRLVTSVEGLGAFHLLILKRPLHAAGWKRPAEHIELVKALLAHGADPNVALARSPTRFGINVTGTIWPGATPMILAARSADLEMIRVLAEGKADPLRVAGNKTTALMAAAGVGRSEGNEDPIAEPDALAAVKLFAEAGVDLDAADTSGVTAMHGAVNNGYNAVIQFLFDRGANINPKDKNGWTPLNVAEIYRNNFREHKESAALLRKLGAIESVPPPESTR